MLGEGGSFAKIWVRLVSLGEGWDFQIFWVSLMLLGEVHFPWVRVIPLCPLCGVSKCFLVLTCYHLLVLWSQELFTESKNFAPVSRYDVSKLATTRRFCPKIAPKGGQIAIFWNTFFWITFPKINIFMPFFHQLLTSGGHRDAQSRIFDFWLFWSKNGRFWSKFWIF